MAETTGISWADATFNPWVGCTKVGPGCDNCYAERDMVRRKFVEWGPGAPRRRTVEANWDKPRAWNRKAAASGQQLRVFCASLADVFDNEVDPGWRMDLQSLIESTPSLTWMLLTKRVGNVRAMVPSWIHRWPANVWLGITVVNQEEADRDIPKLLQIPGPSVRWLSCEPLLGPINLREIELPREYDLSPTLRGRIDCLTPNSEARFYSAPAGIDWVIVGGESGASARPMAAEWARSIRNQCADAGVPFHFKQWGGIKPEANGHLLDGREHRAFPAYSEAL